MTGRTDAVASAAAAMVGADHGATTTVAWLLYSRLLEQTEYREDGSSSVYSALCLGSADSEGLALGYAMLCRTAELPCTLIKGTLNETPHCWNQITVDGTTYYLDLTRADPEEAFLYMEADLLAAGYQWSQAAADSSGTAESSFFR